MEINVILCQYTRQILIKRDVCMEINLFPCQYTRR